MLRKTAHAAMVTLALLAAPQAMAHGSEQHAMHDVPAEGAPRITSFRAEKDPAGGWNIFVTVENFDFAPELVNTPAAAGKGHAHIYAEGVKIARVYGPAYHIADLPRGPIELRFVLNTNDHAEYSIMGRPIEAVVEINNID